MIRYEGCKHCGERIRFGRGRWHTDNWERRRHGWCIHEPLSCYSERTINGRCVATHPCLTECVIRPLYPEKDS